MRNEFMIPPAILRVWDSYLPHVAGKISIDEKLRCLVKISFANMIPPSYIKKLIIQDLKSSRCDTPLQGSV